MKVSFILFASVTDHPIDPIIRQCRIIIFHDGLFCLSAVHLEELNFYEWMYQKRGKCIPQSIPSRPGASGKRSSPIACIDNTSVALHENQWYGGSRSFAWH